MTKKVIRVSAVVIAIVVLLGFMLSMSPKMKIRAFAPPTPKVYGASTSAKGMCTLDLETGRVFYEHNADTQLPMASTTKVATAITAIEAFEEQGRSLDEKLKINDKAVGIEGTSIYLKKGEELTARELLLGIMLRSGNDASSAIALATKPTIAEFAALMNKLAERVGATASNFKNPHGLDEEGHHTTARDLAKIAAYAMKNPTFAGIVKTVQAKIDGAEYPRILHNKNRLLKSLDGCVGVKTGFTKKAGRCYVAAREANGSTTICVVLNCGPMFEEAETLMTSAVEQFPIRQLITVDTFIPLRDEGVSQSDGVGESAAIAIEDFFYPLSDAELEVIKITLDGEEVVVTLNDKEIYRAECNVL